jgi:hypothetical protein
MNPHKKDGIPQGVFPVSLLKFSDSRYPITANRQAKMRTKTVSEPLNCIT